LSCFESGNNSEIYHYSVKLWIFCRQGPSANAAYSGFVAASAKTLLEHDTVLSFAILQMVTLHCHRDKQRIQKPVKTIKSEV